MGEKRRGGESLILEQGIEEDPFVAPLVNGRGKKLGGNVDLHSDLRALVEEVLEEGYLSDAEAPYRRGEIQNYYVFPAGRFRRGKATVKRCVAGHLDRRTLREMFVEVETIAGVEHQPGRALYGLRRQAADLAPEFENDARVLNALSGHRDSTE